MSLTSNPTTVGGVGGQVAGFTGANWHEIVIAWGNLSSLPVVIAHEMGHGVGLCTEGGHINEENNLAYPTPYLMHYMAFPNNNHLTETDAWVFDTFEGY